MNKSKIAIVVSHPIQHFCPWYAHLAQSPLWDLTVFFATDAGQKPYFDKAFGKEVHWSGLDLSFKHVFLNQGGGGATDAVGLEEELDALSPDAIMIYGYSNRLSRRAYRWARAHNKPIMYQSDSELRHSRRLLGRIAKRSYLPRFFRHVDLFFTVGDANEQYLEHYQADSLRFVRSSFPIDIDSFSAAYDARSTLRATIRNIHGISDDDTVVSVVGKLIPIKDHDCLIKAIHHLDDSPARIVLLIIGSGPEEAALKARAFEVKNQRIIFTGFINVDELPAYYAATDIYVHLSSVEPHSLSISEAMYMGALGHQRSVRELGPHGRSATGSQRLGVPHREFAGLGCDYRETR